MMKGFVLVNEFGKYLKSRTVPSHGGGRCDVSFADDINEADVFSYISKELEKAYPKVGLLHRLPAQLEVVRTVRILPRGHKIDTN